MGRRAKSIALHLVGNNPGHKSKAEIEKRKAFEQSLTLGTDKIKPPMWLCKKGKKEFKRLAEQLLQVELMTNADVDLLATYCNAYVEYIECDRVVQEEGIMVEYTNKAAETNKVPHPLLVKKKAAFDIMYKIAADFGFSPASRAKIAIPKKEEKPKTPFEQKFGDV